MDASGNSIGPVTCDEEKPWLDEAPSWSPDGHEIAFLRRWANEYDQLYKVSVDSKAITKLTESDGTAYAEFTPSWSPDGKFIAVGSNQDGDFDIWRVSPTGSGYLNNLTDANSDIDGFPAYMK
jgi:Tol biopolymer transport system component